AQSSDFKELLLRDPLYYAATLKAHAALVRTDDRVLNAVRSTLDTNVDFESAPALRLIESAEPPDLGSTGDASDSSRGSSESKEIAEFYDSTDDEDRPAFPADDPMQMSHAYRLLRALDLVSSVLRDSDQVEDLPLKREVLLETLTGWGSVVADLSSDDSFRDF